MLRVIHNTERRMNTTKYKTHTKDLEVLRGRLKEIAHMSSTIGLLGFDHHTRMPQNAGRQRGEAMAYLSGLAHQKFVALSEGGVLDRLSRASAEGALSPKDTALVREVSKDHARASKLPEDFVREYSEATSSAQIAWKEAREKDNFKAYLPHLEKVFALARKRAELLDPSKNPYDVLLDEYEPGMTGEELSALFGELKDELVHLLLRIKKSKEKMPSLPKRLYPIALQRELTEDISRAIGFDFSSGCIDESVHPFTSGFHPSDVRFTVCYDEHSLWYVLGLTLHEVGHALYEQGLPHKYIGTPLGESASLGVHESQSRFWENMVGRSDEFWTFAYPLMRKKFPKALKGVSARDMYRSIHKVSPSLIRTEADEVTYNLHIIVRFELEKALIEGSISAKNLPELWREKMKECLGVDVPNDRLGVLQDMHWSIGAIGYFPSYTLGNLYSAQIFDAIQKDIPDFPALIKKGEFTPIRAWLNRTIHEHGRRYDAKTLMKRATGAPLHSAPFISYLTEKYTKLYKL